MGAYSGRFMAGSKVTVTPQPDPDSRHGQEKFPDTHWSAPEAAVAQVDGDFAEPEHPNMLGRGLVLDLGHHFGHTGTAVTARARARSASGTSQADAQGIAQDAACAAHGDRQSAYYTPHRYMPIAEPFAGESYARDYVPEGAPGRGTSGRVIAKTHTGGEFSDGPVGDAYTPTGYRLGVTRRWAQRNYSSPTLGAMYSSNALRGVLRRVIAIPIDQPPTGGEIRNSGFTSQQRQKLRGGFNIPALFRLPPSASDQQIAGQQPAPVDGPVI